MKIHFYHSLQYPLHNHIDYYYCCCCRNPSCSLQGEKMNLGLHVHVCGNLYQLNTNDIRICPTGSISNTTYIQIIRPRYQDPFQGPFPMRRTHVKQLVAYIAFNVGMKCLINWYKVFNIYKTSFLDGLFQVKCIIIIKIRFGTFHQC